MAHQTRSFRRQVYRPRRGRYRYLLVRRYHVRRALLALRRLYRQEGA